MLSKVRRIKSPQVLKYERKYVLDSKNYGCTLLIGLQRLNKLVIREKTGRINDISELALTGL